MTVVRALLVLALLASACQTAADQLIQPPPSDRATITGSTSTATPEAASTGSGECVVEGLEVGSMPDLHPSVDNYPEGVVRLFTDEDDCASVDIPVRIAETQAHRSHGLMEVPSIPDAVGMWFTGYTEDRTGGFFMQGTRTDIDIAYVAADGTIVDIIAMVVCDEDPCPTYPPDAPYRTTLEVAPGWFDEVGVTEGDRIELVAREDA